MKRRVHWCWVGEFTTCVNYFLHMKWTHVFRWRRWRWWRYRHCASIRNFNNLNRLNLLLARWRWSGWTALSLNHINWCCCCGCCRRIWGESHAIGLTICQLLILNFFYFLRAKRAKFRAGFLWFSNTREILMMSGIFHMWKKEGKKIKKTSLLCVCVILWKSRGGKF